MTKHLHLKKVLATLLTIAALAAGQQAFATINGPVAFTGYSATYPNNSTYSEFKIAGLNGISQITIPGSSFTFSGQQFNCDYYSVGITGTLNFTTGTNYTDIYTGSQVTIVITSGTNYWFYGATVKKLDGTSVSGCSASANSDHTYITVTIPTGSTFGNIYLDYVPNEPLNNTNTVIGGIEAEYYYTGRPIEPVPTVTYKGTLLTEGTDYTLSYTNTLGPGPATVTVTGTGQYAGTVSVNYNIRAITLNDFTSLGNNTYAIATTADLDHLAGYVKLDNDCQGLTFKQTADIAYTYTTAWNSSTGGETNFTAIGGWGRPFKGTFDGQNHSISGIRISIVGTTDSDKCQGLFGVVDNGGTVRNVVLADTRIKGYDGTGGIVGVNSGTIEDCRVQSNVLVKSSGKSGNGLHGSNFGGIAGSNENNGTVSRCTSSVTINGFVGIHNTEQQYASYLGAIVGRLYDGTLTANYYRGCTVTNHDNPNGTSIGIGVGNGNGSQDQDGARSVHKLTLDTNITATGESVVIDGTTYYASNTTVTLGYDNLPAGQMPVYSVGGTTLENNIFTMPAANRTVTVTLVNAWSGSGTQGDPYVITTTAQLDALAAAVKGGTTYSGTYFVLGNDIAYSTIGLGDTDENFTTIGGYFNGGDKNFSGTFDGQGHTISGIRLYKTGNSNPSKNQGLFGRINGATIKNVILTDARITGYRYVGGIVGNKVSGTVQNCLVLESTITCENTYVGALFGGNSGTITANHYHGCTVNGTANATNVGVGGNGGTSSSSDKNGARSAHILTLGENVTATGESVTYQGTTYYASTTTVTLGYDNLPAGYTVTYTLNGTALTGNTFTMPANDNATVDASTALITYNITYDLDGGSVATANPTTYNVTTPTFTLNNPTKAGYTFTGWTGSNGTTPQTTVTIAQGSTGDLNYTAHWSLNTYNITYDLGGGSVATANPTTYNVQTPTFTLTNPTRAACNFDGWTGTDLTEPTMTVTIAQGSTGDRDYTAHWTQYAFTLTLGTDITASGTVAFTLDGTDYYFAGTEITLAYGGTIPEGQHLVFKVNGNAIEGDTFEMPAADVVVDAVLLERYYTFNSTTGELALLWGEFNKDNKWGSEVTSSAVTSVTATDEVSFTGDCSELFSNFTNCTSMDLGNVNTDALNNTFRMFDKCLSLLSLEGISDWDVSNVTNMIAMFRDCRSLSSFDLSDWNTANVTNMSSMFAGSGSLTTIYVGTGWNTESVTSTSYMFDDCSSLTTIDLSGWNTANVTDMNYMFSACWGLQSLNVSGWNTANVTNMSGMFEGCSGLQSLDLSGWSTANVTNMSGMFLGCSGLQSLDLSGWNTANVTDMSYMFYSCSGLQSLDLTGWNTANVTNMSSMFEGCLGLQSLDLSGWNTAKVTDMSFMFYGCTHLATIYVGEGWSTIHVVIQHSSNMFTNCTSLVGGMGTHYILFHTDKAYARIDGGPHNPGYFTAPFTKEIAGYGNDENPGGYYLIASPVGTVNPENVGNMTANAFDLYRFNQSADLEWENWKAEGNNYHFDLEVGKGYLYANSEDVTLTFTGTLVEGDTYEVTLAKDNGATFAGWNLVGNPFADTAYVDHDFYVMNALGSEIIAAERDYVNPMEGIFVKAEGEYDDTMIFSLQVPCKGQSSKPKHEQMVINLSRDRGSVIDRAIVRMGEGQTQPKFQINRNSTKLYIPQGGTDYAIITSNGQGELPLNFKAETDGIYTLSFNAEEVGFSYLHLSDNMTGADVDLLPLLRGQGGLNQPATYTFTAKTTDYESRFKLVFSTNDVGDTSTGLETEGSEPDDVRTQKMVIE